MQTNSQQSIECLAYTLTLVARNEIMIGKREQEKGREEGQIIIIKFGATLGLINRAVKLKWAIMNGAAVAH